MKHERSRAAPCNGPLPGQHIDQLYLNLVDSHWQAVFRYLWGLTGDRLAAEDLTQDTYVAAYSDLTSVRDFARVRGWLFTIATNAARKHFRRSQREVTLHEEIAGFGDVTPHEGVERGGRLDRGIAVSEVLDRMSGADREILLLVGHFGHTPPEAGEIVGLGAEAAYKRWQRARIRFRRAYEGANK